MLLRDGKDQRDDAESIRKSLGLHEQIPGWVKLGCRPV